MGASVDDVRSGAERVRSAAGRAITVQARVPIVKDEAGTPSITATMAGIGEWTDAGADDVTVNIASFARTLADAPAAMAELADGFRDAVGG
jgi:hypothetical protein